MSGPLAGRRVLALGTGISLLGAIRALRRAGADAYALPDIEGFARHSRYFRPGPDSLRGLRPADLASRIGALSAGTVLIPCSDAWGRALSELPDEIRAKYPVSVPSAAALDVLVDKGRFGDALSRLDLPHPRTRSVVADQDLDGFVSDWTSGWFLKPVDSQQFFARFGVKAFSVTSRSDAGERLRQTTAAGLAVVLQEYLPGPPTNHYFVDGFVDRTGIVRAWFARQRLRMFPPDFGNSTIMVSVPLAEVDDAPRTLETLFADLAYRGIFSAEFKRDPRDGRFKLLEVNTRAWWYVEFALRCGVDVCRLAVHDALEEPVPTVARYQIGRRCVFPYYDYSAVRSEMAAGRLSRTAWFRSWLGAYQPVFRWADPWPAWSEILRAVRRRLPGR